MDELDKLELAMAQAEMTGKILSEADAMDIFAKVMDWHNNNHTIRIKVEGKGLVLIFGAAVAANLVSLTIVGTLAYYRKKKQETEKKED